MKDVRLVKLSALALAIVFLFPVSNVGLSESDTSSQPSDVRYVRIIIPGAESQLLTPFGVDILETYEGFVLARIKSGQIARLQGKGFIVDNMEGLFEISLKTATFDVREGEPAIPYSLRAETSEVGARGYYIVQFLGPIKNQWKWQLETRGAEILGYIPNNAFIVRMTQEVREKIGELRQVTWIGQYQPAYKIDPSLDGLTGIVPIEIVTFEGERVEPVVAFLNKHGYGKTDLTGTEPGVTTYYQGDGSGKVRARVDPSFIPEIARLDRVEFIEPYGQPVLLNFLSQAVHQTNLTPTTVPGARKIWEKGIRGQGQILSIADTGLDFDHNMFRESDSVIALGDVYNFTDYNRRKVIRYLPMANYTGVDPLTDEWAWKDSGIGASPCTSGHGTSTTGILAGNDDPMSIGILTDNDGMAKDAKIFFQDIGTVKPSTDCNNMDADSLDYIPDNLNMLFEPAYAAGARIHSNSWGHTSNWLPDGTYTIRSREIDEYMWNHPDALVAFAVGDYPPVLFSVHEEPTAKNVLAVGATRTYPLQNNMSAHNSWGPTRDGRQKPTIVFTGEGFTTYSDASPWSDIDRDLLMYFEGNSYSAQNAAGHAALVRQYFVDGWYPTGRPNANNSFNPQGSLLIAMLAASGEQLTGNRSHPMSEDRFPNDSQGWGRPLLDNVLYFTGENRVTRIVDSKPGLLASQWDEYEMYVVNNSQVLKILLSWTDYPGTLGAVKALVNDLNLMVTAPDGGVYKGNVWDVFSKGESKNNSGAYDQLNNTEGVIIQSPMKGTWTIRVSAANIPMGPQPYSLVAVGGLHPDAGQVLLDRNLYSENDIVNISVVDVNAVDPLSVNISSTTEPWGEIVNLNETGPWSGVFVGTVNVSFGTPLENGIVEVSEGDRLHVIYQDTSPPHVSHAYARIETMRPIIYDVLVDSITFTAAIITWKTDKPADSRVYYGSGVPLINQKVEKEFTLNHAVELVDLTIETLYLFDVESRDWLGHSTSDDHGGYHYSFKTGAVEEVLLVLGDETFEAKRPEGIGAYRTSLSSKGWSFNEWHITYNGDPTLNLLQKYRVVIWQVGLEQYPPHNDSELTLIKDYLDSGGRLFYLHHDTFWAYCSITSYWNSSEKCGWTKGVLKASFSSTNPNSGDPRLINGIQGSAGDPISTDYAAGGPMFPTRYTPIREGGSADEVTPVWAGGTTTGVWWDRGIDATPDWISVKWLSNATNGTLGTGVWGGFNSRMVGFYANWIDIEYLPKNYFDFKRTDILDKTLIWLLGRDHPDVEVVTPNGGEIFTDNNITITWNRTAHGGTNIGNQSVSYSPDDGQNWYSIATEIPASNTSHTWYFDSSVCNGDQYLVRVEVQDDGIPVFRAFDESNDSFTIARSGGDCGGPLVWPGSVRAFPHPVSGSTVVYINATVDDRRRGNSYINATRPAEFFLDMIGIDGTGYGMNLSSPPTSAVENVTWSGILDSLPYKCYSIFLHGRDVTGKWGPFEMGLLCVQAEPPPRMPPAPPSDVNAVLINNANDVLINWNLSPDDLTYVGSYEIWSSRGTYDKDKGAAYTYLGSTPPGQGEFTHSGVGRDGETYFYFVKAVNRYGGRATESQAVKFARMLSTGRQLVSVPVDTNDLSLSSLLQIVDFESARWYDASDMTDPWESFVPGRLYNDFESANRRMSFWVDVSSASVLSVAGRVPVATSITLRTGWNLVGFPLFSKTYTVADLKAAVPIVVDVETYDATAAPYYLQKIGDMFVMSAGNGYWVQVSSDSTWVLTN